MLTRRNFLGLLGMIPTAASAAGARDTRQLFSAIDDAFPNIIDVSNFGIRGDGKTDNTSALFKLRRHLMARPEVGYTLVFPNGRYHYQDGFWLRGVRAYRLLGNGSVFCNIRPDRYDPRHRTLVLNPGMFTDMNKLPHGTEEHYTSQFGDFIADAAAGASTVELRSTPPAGRYVPGMPVLLHGFAMMFGGYPPSPKFFEWKEVKSIKGRRITLTSPLQHSYHQDWRAETDHPSSYGPPRLSPLRSGAFSLCDVAVIEDVVLERYEGAPSTFTTTGARHVIARNVRVDVFWPSQSEYVLMKNCSVGSMEIDKIVNRLEVEGGTYGEVIEGISCESASFKGSLFTGAVWARPFNAVYEDCAFKGMGGLGQTAAMLLNPNRNGVSLAVRRCRFAPSDAGWVDGRFAIDMVGPAEWTLEAVAVKGGNEVVVPDHHFNSSAFLRPGLPFFIWSKEGRGIVKSIRAASIPEHLILTVSITGAPPVTGDRLAFPTVERVTIEDCKMELPGNYRFDVFRHNQPFAWNMHDTTVFRTSIPVAGRRGGHEFIFGRVSRLEVDVRKPYSGPENRAYLYLGGIGGAEPQQKHRINLRKIGLRTNSIEGGLRGAQQDDQASVLSASQWLGYYWLIANEGDQPLSGTADEMPVVDLRLTRQPFPMN